MDSDSFLTESGRNKSMKETKTTKELTKQTKPIPTSIFLALAAGAMALSFGLAMSRKKKTWANLVGQWAPTILLLGIYDKVSKTKMPEKTENKPLLH